MILDDTDIELVGRWQYHLDPQIPNEFHSFHATNHTGDFAQLNFTGTAVEVFGLKDPTSGRYNITLDGVTTTGSGSAPSRQQSLLFSQQNLDPNILHQMVLTNDQEGFLFAIDIVNITSSGAEPPPVSSPPKSHGFATGTLIAISLVAALIALLLVMTLGFFIWRRRQRRNRNRDQEAAGTRRPQVLTLPNLRNSIGPLANTYDWMPSVYSSSRPIQSLGASARFFNKGGSAVSPPSQRFAHIPEEDELERPQRKRWDTPTTGRVSPLRSHVNSVFFASNPRSRVGGDTPLPPSSPAPTFRPGMRTPSPLPPEAMEHHSFLPSRRESSASIVSIEPSERYVR